MGFVVGYAPRGLSPQIDGMPVIPKNDARESIVYFIRILQDLYKEAAALPL